MSMITTNIVLESYALAVTVLLLLCSWGDDNRKERTDGLMHAMLWGNAALLICTIGALLVEGKPQFEALDYALTFGMSAFGFPIALGYTEYVVCLISEKGSVHPAFLWVMRAICILALVLNFISIFNHMYFVCEGAVYARGSLFWLNMLFSVLILGPDVVLVLIKHQYIGRSGTITMLAYPIFPLIAAAAQFPIPEFNTMCLATTLAILLMYITVYLLRSRKIAEQEKELTDSKVAVMLSQIQPHFLYNALSVIQDMCHGSAPEAEEATIEFSEFLRSNLDSLKLNVPIDFEQELKHTQNYLSLEQKRFGDRLNIEFDIKTTDFKLPALTLQPIVENAVRYGLMKKEDQGTLKISSFETEDGYTVCVIDDGVGFDITKKKDDGRSHIGISNVTERLRVMCSGELTIESEPGKGTTAIITVPKGEDI